jgi:hypothetical protein
MLPIHAFGQDSGPSKGGKPLSISQVITSNGVSTTNRTWAVMVVRCKITNCSLNQLKVLKKSCNRDHLYILGLDL